VSAAAPASEETVVLETPQARITLTTLGGAIKSYQLKGEKFQKTENGRDVPVDLVRVAEGEPYPGALIPSQELGGTGGFDDPAGRASMRVASRDSRSVTFEGHVGAAQVRKRFVVGERPFELGLEVHATAERKGELALVYSGYIPPGAPQPGMCGGLLSGGEVYEIMTPLCRHAGETSRFDGKQAKELLPGKAAWVGLDQHYFVSALLATPEMGECAFFRGAKPGASGAALRLPLDRQLDVTFPATSRPPSTTGP
jgi:YidC/Oxa1 family membrane protein insertase